MRTQRNLSLPCGMKGKREDRSWVIPGIESQVERDDSNPPEGRTIIPDQTQSRLSLDEAEARGPGDPEHASTSGCILDVQSSGKRLRGASTTRRSDVEGSGEETERKREGERRAIRAVGIRETGTVCASRHESVFVLP